MPQQVTTVVEPAATVNRYRVDRWFYIGAGAFVILLSVVGFAPSIIDQSRRNASLTALAIAHGVVSGAWLALFVTQAFLVATGRTAVHRRIGTIGPVLAVVMLAVTALTVVGQARRGYDLSGDADRAFNPLGEPRPSRAEYAPPIMTILWNVFDFGILVAAGLWYRHRPEVHKRLMLLALLGLAGVPVVHLVGTLVFHWPALRGPAPLIIAISLITLPFSSAIYDRIAQGRIHPVSLWVPILLVVWHAALSAAVGPSDAWRRFALWVVQ